MLSVASRWVKGWRLAVILLFLAATVLGFAAWQLFSNKLIISSTSSGVAIKTLWLGEYYTPVSKLVIYAGGAGSEVVRIVAKSGNARMHTVPVRTGTNDFRDAYLDEYSISYSAGRPYSFEAGVPYKVVVHWGYLSSERTFTLP
jgi:hypothetical protein